jgi:hypothetical protein
MTGWKDSHPFTKQRCRKAAAEMTEIKQGRLF